MFDYLEKLQNKPKEVRTRIAFIIAISITVIIFIVWLLTTISDFRNNSASVIETARDSESPFSLIKEEFSGALDEGKAQLEELKKEFENLDFTKESPL